MANEKCAKTETTFDGRSVRLLDCDRDGYISAKGVDRVEAETTPGKMETKPVDVFLNSVGLESGPKYQPQPLVGFLNGRLNLYLYLLKPESDLQQGSEDSLNNLTQWCETDSMAKICKPKSHVEWARTFLSPAEAKERADQFVKRVIDGLQKFLYERNSVDEQAVVILNGAQGEMMKKELGRFLNTAKILYKAAGSTPPEQFATAQLRYGAFKMVKDYIEKDVKRKKAALAQLRDNLSSNIDSEFGTDNWEPHKYSVEWKIEAYSFDHAKKSAKNEGFVSDLKSKAKAFADALHEFEKSYPTLADKYSQPDFQYQFADQFFRYYLGIERLKNPLWFVCHGDYIMNQCPWFFGRSFELGALLATR